MQDFNRQKRLKEEYQGVKLDEKSLYSIAKLIDDNIKTKLGELEIIIVSSNGEDTFRSNNPTIFLSNKIPQHLSSVEIKYTYNKSPIRCTLELSTDDNAKAGVFTVDGEDITAVTGLFHQIDKELKLLTGFEKYIIKAYKNIIFLVIAIITISYGIFSSLEVLTRILVSNNVNFNLDTAFCSMMLGFFLGILTPNFLKKAFPAIQFDGKFKDSGYKRRKQLKWVVMAIVLPIAVNLFSNFIYGNV